MRTSSLRPALALALLAPLAVAAAAGSQEPRRPFEAKARVVAIDLPVEVRNALGTVSRGLAPEDFAIRHGDEELPAVTVDGIGGDPDDEAWRIVVWVERDLVGAEQLVACLANLARRAGDLAALGDVEVVVADPEPYMAQPPTRQGDELDRALSRLALEAPGADRLEAIRRNAISAPDEEPAQEDLEPGEEPAPAGAAALLLEVETGLGSLDRLLTWIAEQPAGGPRVLLWVHGGLDPQPDVFYRERFPDLPVHFLASARQLRPALDATAHALAGFGWLLVPLALTDLDIEAEEGMSEFDRWRYQTADGEQGFGTSTITFKVPLGGGKKKERGASAEDEADLLQAPHRALAPFAEASGGAVVTRPDELAETLRSLERRVLVTFQAPWPLDGRLRPVEVVARGGSLRTRAPLWVRSGTPEAVAEARLRRLASGATETGDLFLEVTVDEAAGRLTVSLDEAPDARPVPPLESEPARVTVVYGDGPAPPRFVHHPVERGLGESDWTSQLTLEPTPDDRWVAVLVESLAEGRWGAEVVELGP